MMDEITTVSQFIDGAVQFKEEPYFTDEKLRNFTQLMLDAQMSGLDIDTDVGIGKTPKMRIWIRHPNFAKADKMGDVQTMAFRAMNGLLNEIFRQRWHIEQLQAEIKQQPAPDVTARALELEVEALRGMAAKLDCSLCPTKKSQYPGCYHNCLGAICEACEAQARAEAENKEATK